MDRVRRVTDVQSILDWYVVTVTVGKYLSICCRSKYVWFIAVSVVWLTVRSSVVILRLCQRRSALDWCQRERWRQMQFHFVVEYVDLVLYSRKASNPSWIDLWYLPLSLSLRWTLTENSRCEKKRRQRYRKAIVFWRRNNFLRLVHVIIILTHFVHCILFIVCRRMEVTTRDHSRLTEFPANSRRDSCSNLFHLQAAASANNSLFDTSRLSLVKNLRRLIR